MSVTPLVDPSIPTGQNSEAELRSRQRAIESNRRNINAGNAKDKEAKLRESCEGFEAMFIQKMWEGMRATLPQDGLMHSRDEKQWQSMYDQELGKSMAKSGGIGLADMMVSQMSKNLQSASEVAAGSASRRKPMDIAPVPLLPEQAPAPTTAGKAAMAPTVALAAGVAPAKTAGAMDIYGGPAEDPVAPPPPDAAGQTGTVSATGAAGAAGAAGATGATGVTAAAPVVSPPEVQAALANLATQAGVARDMGTRAAQQHSAMTEAAFNNLPGATVASIGAATTMGAAIPAAFTPGTRATGRAAGSLATGAAMNPANPMGAAADRTSRSREQDAIPPSTYRPRVSARSRPVGDQPARAGRRAAGADPAANPDMNPASAQTMSSVLSGSNFATSSAYPSAGQNMPTSSMADAAADLMKSQVQPSVKTKL